MGLFSNSTLIQSSFKKTSSIEDSIFLMQDAFLDALENEISYDQLLKISRSKQIKELIQVGIIYEPLHKQNYSFDLDMGFSHSGTAKFNVLWKFEEQDDDTTLLRIEYKTDIFHSSTIQRMIAHFEIILSAMEIKPLVKLVFVRKKSVKF